VDSLQHVRRIWKVSYAFVGVSYIDTIIGEWWHLLRMMADMEIHNGKFNCLRHECECIDIAIKLILTINSKHSATDCSPLPPKGWQNYPPGQLLRQTAYCDVQAIRGQVGGRNSGVEEAGCIEGTLC